MVRIELSEISKSYGHIGFDERRERPNLKGIVYIVFCLPFLTINELVYVIRNWDDVEHRVNGIKGLLLYSYCIMYVVSTFFMWKRTKLVVNIVEEGQYKFPFQPTKRREELERKIREDATKLATVWYYLLVWFVVSGILTSVVVFFVQTAQNGIKNLTAEMLLLPLPFFYPENYNTLPCYLFTFLMQAFSYVQISRSGYLVAVGSYVAITQIEGGLQLLGLSVDEMDGLINVCTTDQLSGLRPGMYDYRRSKMFLAYLVRHHYDIHRKVKEVTKGMALATFTLNSGMSLLLCTTIFSLVKGTKFVFKVQEGCFSCVVFWYIYNSNLMGENLSNEDENLRQKLYNIEWIDKPLWLKKSLLLIMTRMNRTIELKSTGLFTLNLKSLLTILQAAYSLYNMLINLRK